MPSSPLYHHAFTWEGNAEQVVVTGSFDHWSSSLPLRRIDGTNRWEAQTSLKWGEKVVYKFVVDSQWLTSPYAPTERDWNGNENNVLFVPSLSLPPVTQETLDDLASHIDALEGEEKRWRTVRLVRWTGSAFALFAALPPSPALTFNSLRYALLPALVEGGEEGLPRSFAFARLAACPEEGVEVVEESDGEAEVGKGTYVLVGADAVLPLRLKHFPLPAPPQASASSSLVAEELDVPTPPSALLTPSSLSRIPRSTTRYFDFDHFDSSEGGDDERSYAYSVTGSASEFSEVEPHESRSRAASFAAYGGREEEQEKDDDDERMDDLDARSDATFNTALSQGWTSSLGGRGVAAASTSEGVGGWTSGGFPAEESSGTEGSGEVLPGPVCSAVGEGDGRERVNVYEVVEGISGEEAKEVAEACVEGKVVFLPYSGSSSKSASHFLPLALHPTAIPLLPLIRPTSALLASFSSDKEKRAAELDTAHLPTPPASPPTFRRDGLALPSFASSAVDGAVEARSNLNEEELEKAVQEQLERGLGRWVVVRCPPSSAAEMEE